MPSLEVVWSHLQKGVPLHILLPNPFRWWDDLFLPIQLWSQPDHLRVLHKTFLIAHVPYTFLCIPFLIANAPLLALLSYKIMVTSLLKTINVKFDELFFIINILNITMSKLKRCFSFLSVAILLLFRKLLLDFQSYFTVNNVTLI